MTTEIASPRKKRMPRGTTRRVYLVKCWACGVVQGFQAQLSYGDMHYWIPAIDAKLFALGWREVHTLSEVDPYASGGSQYHYGWVCKECFSKEYPTVKV